MNNLSFSYLILICTFDIIYIISLTVLNPLTDPKIAIIIALTAYLVGTSKIELPPIPDFRHIPNLPEIFFPKTKPTKEDELLEELKNDLKNPKNGATIKERLRNVKKMYLNKNLEKNEENDESFYKTLTRKLKKLIYSLTDFSTPVPYTIVSIGGMYYFFIYKKNLNTPEALGQMARDAYQFAKEMSDVIVKASERTNKVLKDYLDSSLKKEQDQAKVNNAKCEKMEIKKEVLEKENISLRENYWQETGRDEINFHSLESCKAQLKEEVINRRVADEQVILSEEVLTNLQKTSGANYHRSFFFIQIYSLKKKNTANQRNTNSKYKTFIKKLLKNLISKRIFRINSENHLLIFLKYSLQRFRFHLL